MEQDDNYYQVPGEGKLKTFEISHAEKETNKNKKTTTKKKKKTKTAKSGGENSCTRFSDEQVKLMESVFRQATKLEPRKKVELANDIGLHPRQVSIWFQNKRARWKSKQMESEYRVLKHDFDSLNQQFESSKKENLSLLEQIQKLRKDLFEENSKAGYRDSEIIRNKRCEAKENNNDDDDESSSGRGLWSDEDGEDDVLESSGVEKYFRKNQEVLQFLNMQSNHEQYGRNSSLASPDKNWCDLPVPSGEEGFLNDDESCSPSSWLC